MESVKVVQAREDVAPSGPVSPGLPGQAFHETRSGWVALAAVWVTSAIYLGSCLNRGWVPHDAGVLGLMAERVLQGQVPHRDFLEIYTGGLTYLNALAFRLFGVNLLSLRIPLFLFFVGWVPAVYFIARRFVSPWVASAVTLLGVAWSVPSYPESMPSWYNLFFATWGLLALMRYTETERRRWLFVAGLCGGLSFLFKLSGLYFLAAGLLFLIFREQSGAEAAEQERRGPGIFYHLFVTAGLLTFLGVEFAVVRYGPLVPSLFNFELPSACLVTVLLWREWTQTGGRGRFRRILELGFPFLGGAAAPVAAFLAFYAWAGAIHPWLRGVFVLPTSRLTSVALGSLSPLELCVLGPFLALLYLLYCAHFKNPRMASALIIAGLAALLVGAGWSLSVYLAVGMPLSLLVPLAAMALLARLWHGQELPEAKRQSLFMIVAVASVCALIEFPYASPTYFCYVAPLVALAITAILSTIPRGNRVVLGGVLGFYLVFALWLHTPGYFAAMARWPDQPLIFQTLRPPRAGGLRITAEQAKEYEEVVRLLQAHARGGYIYAGPDSPEIYFLSGYRDPLSGRIPSHDPGYFRPASLTQRVLAAIDRDDINLVVLKSNSKFSGPPPEQLRRAVESSFPFSAKVGIFDVRWK